MRERFENMLAYTANETECRSAVLQRYFGDAEAEDCGVCDICLAKRRRAKSARAIWRSRRPDHTRRADYGARVVPPPEGRSERGGRIGRQNEGRG